MDAQIDETQAELLSLDFSPCDVPRDKFLVAGEVWAQCREGEVKPEACGADRFRGEWFVRNNVLRDLAALNGVEVLPWDEWGLALQPSCRMNDSDIIEQAASIGRSPGGDLVSIRELYGSRPELRVVDCVKNSETDDFERLHV